MLGLGGRGMEAGSHVDQASLELLTVLLPSFGAENFFFVFHGELF